MHFIVSAHCEVPVYGAGYSTKCTVVGKDTFSSVLFFLLKKGGGYLGVQQVGQDQGHRAGAALVAVHQRCPPRICSLLDEVCGCLEVLLDGLPLRVLQRDAGPPVTAACSLLQLSCCKAKSQLWISMVVEHSVGFRGFNGFQGFFI